MIKKIVIYFSIFILFFTNLASEIEKSNKIMNAWEENNWHKALDLSKNYHNPYFHKHIYSDYLLSNNFSGNYLLEVEKFLTENPNWIYKEQLLRKADSNIPFNKYNKIINWYLKYPPQTILGKKNHLKAIIKTGNYTPCNIVKIIKTIWINDVESSFSQQVAFLRKYKKYLTKKDHQEKIDQLLYKNNLENAEKFLFLLRKNKKEINIAKCRILLQKNDKKAKGMYYALLKKHYINTGLINDFLTINSKKTPSKRQLEHQVQMLDLVDNDEKYRNNFANIRRAYAYGFLRVKDYHSAYKTISRHNAVKNTKEYNECCHLAGFISLCKINQPNLAIKYFLELTKYLKYPSEKSKNYYFLSRCFLKNKKIPNHNQRYNFFLDKASLYPFTFYGQVSLVEQKKFYINLKTINNIEQHNSTHLKDIIFFISKIVHHKKYIMADLIITDLFKILTKNEIKFVVEKIKNISQNLNWKVKLGNTCANKGLIFYELLFPRIKLNTNYNNNLVNGIIKQESSFIQNAMSNKGAMGLMQIIPPTAKKYAKALKMKNIDKIDYFNPKINIKIGCFYLKKLVKMFHETLPLAIASYNAGEKQVTKWVKNNKYPKKGNIFSKVNWIESIAFTETKLYVQRVLANKSMYHAMQNNSMISILKDIS